MVSDRIRSVVGSVVLACALLVAAQASAQVRPKVLSYAGELPKRMLFIGNSFFYYNNGMQNQVLGIARAADPDNKGYGGTMVTISGSAMDWHNVEGYFTNKAMASYSFDENNNIVMAKRDKLYDAAIMMDCSLCPIHPELKAVFTEFAGKQIATVRTFNTVPVLFMSWAYSDKPEMTQPLSDAYTTAGNDNNALVIPAGLAFARALKARPELVLHAADRRHPSPAGTYLAAATVYATLYRRSPVGNKFRATLDEATANFLQTVAWETVQDYFREGN
jgi:hypothetical protein